MTSISHVKISQAMNGNLNHKHTNRDGFKEVETLKKLFCNKFSIIAAYLKARLFSASSGGSSIMYRNNCSTWV